MLQSMRLSLRVPLRSVRWNSTAGPTLPPLMTTLRNDLKTAMRAKDTHRLNVLRALISETNNAAKTASPIQTDIQLLSLIRKRASAAKEAAEEFAKADRADLKEKEDAQIAILQEYAGHVKTLSTEEVEAVIAREIDAIKEAGKKLEIGQVLKSLFATGGALDGKPADRKEVAGLVKQALSS
ncbi:hypothetical protein POX_e06223 [Penicillium oxalicum]|uniref:Altered inheritance of mitochondria protein 41 n=1 Tax=Penicillium oxalicum (strain 114-2 / CGMCC 5302) TaxID=933388 RepID=S8AMX6_PENO1|nr:hypothetical protein POX_e06223 [Penicillium oxalicum]EPS27248.1 hypothetical protein PDE_02191 [Penicillium oxalicum 114-2]KAI2788210.1 hypothetical protein POX_e06223 [Penicillium oxalicum]